MVNQNEHGTRASERQRVNGQPNDYVAITEAELHLQRLDPERAARIAAVMHPDPEVARALTAKRAAAAKPIGP